MIMGAAPPPKPRSSKTQEQLRTIREQSAQRHAVHVERRRLEDHVREERHDARATTICAGTFAERRQHRSEKELRAQRGECQRQWEARQRRGKLRRMRSTKAKPR